MNALQVFEALCKATYVDFLWWDPACVFVCVVVSVMNMILCICIRTLCIGVFEAFCKAAHVDFLGWDPACVCFSQCDVHDFVYFCAHVV